jgi:DNA-binding NtrC family response regulator
MHSTENHERKQVWIVDDEPELAESYADFLSDEFSPRVFPSAESALAAWEQTPSGPDLLVSDLRMPGTDGLTLVEKIRDRGEDQPVLMISGHAEKGHVMRAQELRVEGFLEKPFDPEKLRQAARRVLATREARSLDEQLISLSQLERVQYERVVSACVERYARAEDLAEGTGRLFGPGRDVRTAFLRQLYGENQLHRSLGEISSEIEALLKSRAAQRTQAKGN